MQSGDKVKRSTKNHENLLLLDNDRSNDLRILNLDWNSVRTKDVGGVYRNLKGKTGERDLICCLQCIKIF